MFIDFASFCGRLVVWTNGCAQFPKFCEVSDFARVDRCRVERDGNMLALHNGDTVCITLLRGSTPQTTELEMCVNGVVLGQATCPVWPDECVYPMVVVCVNACGPESEQMLCTWPGVVMVDSLETTILNNDASVLQSIIEVEEEQEHNPEIVAQIPEEEAANTTNSIWASCVQSKLATANESPKPRCWILTFSRHPQELEEAILQSPPAQNAVADGVEIKPEWGNGAKILCEDLDISDFDQELTFGCD